MVRRVFVSGEKLAALRRARYLTQDEFADELGMSSANVRRLERAGVGGMQYRNFRRLAELLKVTPDELAARIGAPAPDQPVGGGGATALIEEGPQPASIVRGSRRAAVEVDRFHGVSAARPEERTPDARDSSPVPAGSSGRFAVTVDGDCMEPKYRHGDVVIFSVEAAEREGIQEGRNYFIQFDDGENTFKRVFPHPADPEKLVLRCWNPEYPQRTVERRRIRLLARAVYRLVPDEG